MTSFTEDFKRVIITADVEVNGKKVPVELYTGAKGNWMTHEAYTDAMLLNVLLDNPRFLKNWEIMSTVFLEIFSSYSEDSLSVILSSTLGSPTPPLGKLGAYECMPHGHGRKPVMSVARYPDVDAVVVAQQKAAINCLVDHLYETLMYCEVTHEGMVTGAINQEDFVDGLTKVRKALHGEAVEA